MADAIGGVVKRALDRQITYGKDINNASDVFVTLDSFVKAVKVFLIPESDINAIGQLIPTNLKTVKGTMNIHQIISIQGNNEIQHRKLSCFCSKTACTCYEPVTHQFQNMPKVDHCPPSESRTTPKIYPYSTLVDSSLPTTEETDQSVDITSLPDLAIIMEDELELICVGDMDVAEEMEIIDTSRFQFYGQFERTGKIFE